LREKVRLIWSIGYDYQRLTANGVQIHEYSGAEKLSELGLKEGEPIIVVAVC
jgi:hypothetical protein